MGGTQDFPDGGEQASMGGDKSPMGWGPPPSPHTGKPCVYKAKLSALFFLLLGGAYLKG